MEVVIGGIITIFVAVCVEWIRQPQLTITLADAQDQLHGADKPARHLRALRLKVSNESPRPWFRWVSRETAANCWGAITFHHLDGQAVYDRPMYIRWTRSPEPIPHKLLTPDGHVAAVMIDPERITLDSRRSIYAGEFELVDVAVRLDNEDDCYGWNNESYAAPAWRNPNWRLTKGRYLVRVEIKSSGRAIRGLFRLANDVSRPHFRLEDALPEDKKKFRH